MNGNGLRTMIFLAGVLFLSCESLSGSYQIAIRNDYFETLETVKLGAVTITALEPSQTSAWHRLSVGVIPVVVLTESGIQLKANITLQGTEERHIITINRSGDIVK